MWIIVQDEYNYITGKNFLSNEFEISARMHAFYNENRDWGGTSDFRLQNLNDRSATYDLFPWKSGQILIFV